MRIPRDIDHYKLIKLLNRCGYVITRQTGSHVRLTRNETEKLPKHHITIPSHNPIRIGKKFMKTEQKTSDQKILYYELFA